MDQGFGGERHETCLFRCDSLCDTTDVYRMWVVDEPVHQLFYVVFQFDNGVRFVGVVRREATVLVQFGECFRHTRCASHGCVGDAPLNANMRWVVCLRLVVIRWYGGCRG